MKKFVKHILLVCLMCVLMAALSISVFATDANVTAEITGAQVTLGSDLSMTYRAEISGDVKFAEMRFTMNEETTAVVGTKYSEGVYLFKFEDIAPYDMGTTIKAELYVNGDETAIAVKESYSILENCKALLGKYSDNAKMKTLIADLLEYGAASQLYVNKDLKLSELVNADITGKSTFPSKGIASDTAITTIVSDAYFKSAGVWFGTRNRIYVRFVAADMSNISIKVSVNGGEAKDYTELIAKNDEDYVFYTDPIYAINMDDVYTFELYKGSTCVHTLRYSVKSYVASKSASANAAMANLAKALWNYGVSAKNYADIHSHEWVKIAATTGNCLIPGTSEGLRCSGCDAVIIKPMQTVYGPHQINDAESKCELCGIEITDNKYFKFVLVGTNTYAVAANPEVPFVSNVVVIPSEYNNGGKVVEILDNAFYNYSHITRFEIPATIETIGDSAFAGCTGLTTLKLSAGLTTIGNHAFEDCYNITGVLSIPNTVKTVGESAFENCAKLSGITIPEGIKTIDDRAFAGCSTFTTVSIPTTVTKIGDDAFYACTSLLSINVAPLNNTYMSVNNCLINTKTKTLLLGCNNGVIPSGVTAIADNAFYMRKAMTSIVVPEGVKTIGDSAFFMCEGVKTVVLPKSLTDIGDYAFYGCNKILAIYFKGTESAYATFTANATSPILTKASVYFYSEEQPSTATNRWHYVDGVPTVWEPSNSVDLPFDHF